MGRIHTRSRCEQSSTLGYQGLEEGLPSDVAKGLDPPKSDAPQSETESWLYFD